ncbi:MAG: PQQ-binding-like beta-propeller repeat protein [Bryobacteraceae bacterium]
MNRILTFVLAAFLGNACANAELRVVPAWTHHTDAVAPNERAARIAAFEATPVLAGQLLYVITPFNQVLALDPGTGAERWRFDPEIAKDRAYSEGTARGVTVVDNTVLFGTLDARLIALRASDGKRIWDVPIAPGIKDGNFQITSPPVVVGQTVIVGSGIGDNGRAEMQRGVVRAFDLRTGKPKWSWDPTPPGKTGAANAWSLLTADAKRDMVFLPTGSASPDFFGGLRPGDNHYANSVAALRASSGELLWSFQVVHHDLWDYDVASAPILVTFKRRPAIAVLTKIGHYFVLDRETGKPLLPIEERAVPRSDVPGEAASSTQPFPVSGRFTEQTFVPRPGWCTERASKLRYEGIFTPPSVGGTLVFPGNVGGANWGGGSYDPVRGLIFTAANRLATEVRLIPREAFDRSGHGDTGERLGLEYGPQTGAPFGMSRRTFLGPDGRPCNQEPWGALTAIEVETGKLRWESPITTSLGGPLYVNGAVFFGGGVFENKFRAFSAENGRKLFETDLPFTANSTPGTYEWRGKRYVVISAGGHGKVDGSKLGDLIMAFTLEQ